MKANILLANPPVFDATGRLLLMKFVLVAAEVTKLKFAKKHKEDSEPPHVGSCFLELTPCI